MSIFIKRNCVNPIVNHLDSKEITMLVGPRQAGKTTIMLHIKAQLDKIGKKHFISTSIVIGNHPIAYPPPR